MNISQSHGTDLANYGINSSSGTSESSHPFTCAFLAAHNTVGQYTNGRIVHGGSGGNGIITLDSSIGNEMSHEAGHNVRVFLKIYHCFSSYLFT